MAQANAWSLEELYLDVFVGDDDSGPMSMDDASFGIEKLKLQGATCSNNSLSICSAIVTDLHTARLRWLLKSQAPAKPPGRSIPDESKNVLYENPSLFIRKHLKFILERLK